jgi:AAA+ superfamily predicted ATPase
MLAFAETLHTYLSASYPFLYLVTFEESRTVGLIRQLAGALGRPVTVWRPEESTDPAQMLQTELERLMTVDGRGVHVFIDAHPYLAGAERVRQLRVLQRRLATTGAHVVFVSPALVRPDELIKDWTVLQVPLPDRVELEATLEGALPAAHFAGLDRERLALAALGLTAREAQRAFERARHLASMAAARRAAFDWESVIVEEKRRLIASDGALEFCALNTDLQQLGGLDELKRWLEQRRMAFGEAARRFGLPQPRGLMLVGVQGCGKSLAAKAVAGFWGIPLLRLDLGTLFSSSTAPDEALRRAIHTAEALAPCVLWIDEIEKGFDPSAGGEATRLLGSLLTWLQEKSAPVFFVATANRVDSLPPELLRRGRFDELFFVDLPEGDARAAILAIHLANRGRDPQAMDLPQLAEITDHYSGAELEQLVIAGLYTAFAEGRDVTPRDLVVAARQMIPLYNLYETEIKALRTWAKDRARPAGTSRRLKDLFARTPNG